MADLRAFVVAMNPSAVEIILIALLQSMRNVPDILFFIRLPILPGAVLQVAPERQRFCILAQHRVMTRVLAQIAAFIAANPIIGCPVLPNIGPISNDEQCWVNNLLNGGNLTLEEYRQAVQNHQCMETNFTIGVIRHFLEAFIAQLDAITDGLNLLIGQINVQLALFNALDRPNMTPIAYDVAVANIDQEVARLRVILDNNRMALVALEGMYMPPPAIIIGGV